MSIGAAALRGLYKLAGVKKMFAMLPYYKEAKEDFAKVVEFLKP